LSSLSCKSNFAGFINAFQFLTFTFKLSI
jgi:hypothetical protein